MDTYEEPRNRSGCYDDYGSCDGSKASSRLFHAATRVAAAFA
jgi:hypothetical protein